MAIDRERILHAAQKYVDKKKYDRAIAEYQKIIQEDPNDARTLLKIGDLQSRMGAHAEAIGTYDRVGQYYAAQGFALKAIAVYKQIRELIQKHAPHLADRYGHIVPKLAEIYTQLGLTSDALAAYDEVATRLQRAGRDRDAIDVFRRMVELDSNNPLPHLRLAEACCRVQSLDEAIDSFWAAAELLIRMNRRDDALKVLDRILHFRQDPKFAKLSAQLYLERGAEQDGMQALAKLQISFQADPRDLDTLSLLGQAFTAIGQQNKAVEVYKEMGRVAREQGNTELYQQVVDHLMAIAPNDEQVRALANIGPESAGPPPPEVETEVVSMDAEELLSVDAASVPPDEVYEVDATDYASEAPTAGARASSPDVVVVEADMEAAEELSQIAQSFDAAAHARKAIVDAESFRKLRLYSKAIETLQIALEVDPHSIEVREKLRDLLAESGDVDGSVGESITIAGIYLDQGYRDHAEAILYTVLETEPEHPHALQLLEELGALVPSNEDTVYDAQPEYDEASTSVDALPGRDSYATIADDTIGQEAAAESAQPAGEFDPNEPLPSYDLEEVSAAEALGPEASSGFDSVDDPFTEAPLPSFPLGAQEVAPPDEDLEAGLDEPAEAIVDEELEDLGAESVHDEPLPSFADAEEAATSVADMPPGAPAAAAAPDASAIEEVLEEAEFFAARGLLEDARMILVDQLERSPNHPLLQEHLRDIEEQLSGGAPAAAPSPAETPISEPAPDDNAFDIAASLDALDEFGAPEAEDPGPGRPAFGSQAEEVDVDQVFAQFKEGVKQQVSDKDSATHYDLGVAYKEMGLLPDAIHEFEVAAKDPSRECMCWAMVGMIHLEQNQLDKAAEAFVKGLHAEQKTADQEMSLYYDLGSIYESKQNTDEALYYFQLIAKRDINYRDVKERIAALQPREEKGPEQSAARPIGEDDEFDKVFDELFDTKSS